LCKQTGEDKEALIADLQALVKRSKQLSVNKMIGMIEDLQDQGMDSRFVKHLAGPVHELKARTPEGVPESTSSDLPRKVSSSPAPKSKRKTKRTQL
jgi:hypothetical protein